MVKELLKQSMSPSPIHAKPIAFAALLASLITLISYTLLGLSSIVTFLLFIFCLSCLLLTLSFLIPSRAAQTPQVRQDAQTHTQILCHDITLQMPDLVWVIDYASRTVRTLNQNYLTSHPQPSSSEKRLASILPSRVARLFLESLIQTQNQKKTMRFEYQIGCANQSDAPLTFEARLFASSNNECIALIREITHIKATEEALINQQLFLQQIVDNSPDLIFVRDRHGRFLLVNRATQATLGHELLAQSHNGLNEHQVLFEVGDHEVLSTGQTAKIIEKVTLPDGRIRWYEVTKLPLVREGETYLLCIAMDVSHFHAEDAAHENADTFIRALSESLPTPFVISDNGYIVFANRACCEILDSTPDQLIGVAANTLDSRAHIAIQSVHDIDCVKRNMQLITLSVTQ